MSETGARAPLSRAARKRLELAAELRAEIVEAALAEFASAGYHATTIAAIAARLDVSSGTIYNHFKNKRDIVEAVVDRLSEQVVSALTKDAPGLASSESDYRAQSGRIADAVDQIFAADIRIPRLLLFEATAIDAAMTARIMGLFDLSGQLAAAYLAHGVEQGFLRDDFDIPAAADAISGMILSIALRSLTSDLTKQQRQTMRDTVIDLMLRGVGA